MNKLYDITNPRKAITGNLKINGDIKDNIFKLLESGISFSAIRVKNSKSGTDFKKMHSDIKDWISKDLGIKKQDVKDYEIYYSSSDEKCYFFYLKEDSSKTDEIYLSIQRNELKLYDVFTRLLRLVLKLQIFRTMEDEGLTIPVDVFNSDLYINAIPQNAKKEAGNTYVDTFRLEMFYTGFDELTFNLKSQTFDVDLDNDILLDEHFILGTKDKKYIVDSDKKINATRKNQTSYMKFGEKYNETKNYSEQYILKKLTETLVAYKIDYSNVIYDPDYMFLDFLNYNKKIKGSLIVVDNYNYKTGCVDQDALNLKYKSAFYKYLLDILNKEGVDDVQIVDASELSLESFDSLKNYIVLSKLNEGGSSIVGYKNNEAHDFKSFEDALVKHEKNPEIIFDYYTNIKLNNHKDHKNIIQGINVKNLYITDKDGNHKLNEQFTSINRKVKPNTISFPQIKKVCTEIWLKGAIFRDKKMSDFQVKDGRYNVYYTRRKKLNSRTMSVTLNVLHIEVKNKELNIVNFRTVTGKKIKEEEVKYKSLSKTRYKDFNDTFCVLDLESNEVLTVYNSSAIPRIMGNPYFNTYDLYNEKGGKSIHRKNGEKECILPFVVNPTRKSQERKKGSLGVILVESKDNITDIFVTSRQPMNSTLDKSNLIYRVFILNEDGNLINPIGNDLFNFYLTTHIDDVVNVNDCSRTSLLRKIVKEYSE
jgi:hypothetical protein